MKKLICKLCHDEGKTSYIYEGGATSQLRNYQIYYDELGEHHDHDPNEFRNTFKCSNGHVIVATWVKDCSNNNCMYGKDSLKLKFLKSNE